MKRKSRFPEDLLFSPRTAADVKPEAPRESGSLRPDPTAARANPNLLDVFLRILALKGLYRQGWLKRGVPESVCESVADHSFGTAILALLVAGRPPFQDADPVKTCRMALVHELGEVYAGDITPVDGITKETKYRMERDSLLRVLEGAPGAGELRALWEEFEEGVSPEARLLRRLDRLEMGIQAAVYRADGFPRMEEFLESARKAVGDGYLKEVLERAVDSERWPVDGSEDSADGGNPRRGDSR